MQEDNLHMRKSIEPDMQFMGELVDNFEPTSWSVFQYFTIILCIKIYPPPPPRRWGHGIHVKV